MNNKKIAIDMLAAGAKQVDVAKRCGVDEATIHRWISEVEFSAALRKQTAENMRQSARLLQTAFDLAVQAMISALTDEDVSHAQKIRAANSVISNAAKWFAVTELDDRLSDLEARL